MKINRVCILGGGTSGFATASVLAKYRKTCGLKFDIKLVHSESIGSIGVGESTLFSIRELFSYLDLKDSDWMPSCNATYKTSVRFENFYKKGRYFYYPFGIGDPTRSVTDWFILKELLPEIYTPERSSIYFHPGTIFNEENKLTSDYVRDNAAYHFDSKLMGEFLQRYSEDLGVEVVNDTFYGTEQDKYGNIESIVCDNGTYHADLFVDCSGFNSLLLGKTMSEEYIPYDKTLINNKALVAKIPYKNKNKQLKNYTNSVALQNGWIWETPLWDCLAYGYVHTNRFATEEEIEQEFFKHVGEVDYRTVHFKTGRYNRGWVKNVVAVGLSYGFVEPLEATGIATTLENIFRLLECLSKRDLVVTQVDRDLFNHSIGKQIDRYKEFVERHYYLSSRDDTEYWRYVTDVIDYNSSSEFLDQMIVTRNLSIKDKGGEWSGDLYVCGGMNYSCYSKAFTLKSSTVDNLHDGYKLFEEYLKELKSSLKKFSSSFKYQNQTVHSKGF